MIEVTRKNSEIIPLSLEKANRFIVMFHRHNKPVKHGAKFAIGLLYKGELIGVAIAGIPRARLLNDGKTAEILRVCVKDGYKNANSMLYGRMKRILQLMGYKRIVTYTLKKEKNVSLKALDSSQLLKLNHKLGIDHQEGENSKKSILNLKLGGKSF